MTLPHKEDADGRVERLTWKKGSRSSDSNSNCVELACAGREILVRDSKNPRGGNLAFPRAAVEALIAGVDR